MSCTSALITRKPCCCGICIMQWNKKCFSAILGAICWIWSALLQMLALQKWLLVGNPERISSPLLCQTAATPKGVFSPCTDQLMIETTEMIAICKGTTHYPLKHTQYTNKCSIYWLGRRSSSHSVTSLEDIQSCHIAVQIRGSLPLWQGLFQPSRQAIRIWPLWLMPG